MKTDFHPASERGHANHGWLDTYHNFSFGTYFNPSREKFGCLRVLNDDTVSGGTGFDLHPHNNMEIITIVMKGALAHRDSLGNVQVIKVGEVQVMTAGTGVYHSEYNHSASDIVQFFQLWIFPKAKGLQPRYDQKMIPGSETKNQPVTLVTPFSMQEPGTLWIHQDAYISMVNLEKGKSVDYQVKIAGNGVFVMNIEGTARVADTALNRRDAVAVSESDNFEVAATENTRLLLVEVPMK